jgi:nucleoside-diphosphate-sugar epimerase
MEVLITGGSGFIGSWIARLLSVEGFEVTVLVRNNSNIYRLKGIENLTIIRASDEDWTSKFESHLKKIVIMTDWWGVHGLHRNDPQQESNAKRWKAMGTILEKSQVSLVIALGSQAELGPVQGEILENSPDLPTTNYGEAKVAAKNFLIEKFRNSDTRFIWARAFSVYGQLDADNWFIPSLTLALKNRVEYKMTKGEQVWSYLHVFDFAKGVISLIQDVDVEGIVNIANPETITISQVAHKIATRLDAAGFLEIGKIEYRHDQVMSLKPRTTKLNNLGWQPSIDLDEGINQTVDWFLGEKIDALKLKSGEEFRLDLPIRS